MRISDAIEKLQEVLTTEGDGEVLFSRGDYSLEAIDVQPYTFCERHDGNWEKCLFEDCERPKITGVLFV
jgi:hypothetical protein